MRSKRLFSLLAILTLLISLTIALPITSADGGDDSESLPSVPQKQPLQYPNLGSHLSGLAEGYEAGQTTESQAASETPINSGGSIAVTIYLNANVDAVVRYLEDNGGDPRNVGEDYIEAYVPVRLLGRLSQQPGVIRVREIIPPEPAGLGNVVSQGVAAHLAEAWHDAGITGEGIKVGVIDIGFEGFSDLIGTELTAVAGVRCYSEVGVFSTSLADCEGEDVSVHGTAVAETVLDIAPDVTLYVANPLSRSDLQATVEWMISEDVSVINESRRWSYDGPGDGTSTISISPLNTVDRAVDGGTIWVNSAGNYNLGTWFSNSPNIYTSSISNVDFVAFDGSDDISNRLIGADAYISAHLRWDDSWLGASSDLDLRLWDYTGGEYVAFSEAFQTGEDGHYPVEYLAHHGIPDRLYGLVVIHRSGSVPDWIQLVVSGSRGVIEHYTGEGSINNPSESANPGMLAVGATNHLDTNTIEDYSSRGPTPDGRLEVKPDIVGVACADTVSYVTESDENGEFCGTSQASPHVAGLAALVLQANPDFTPVDVAEYLKDNAAERGAAGPDNVWGHGFAQLPAPATGDCVTPITADGSVPGTWAADCESEVSGRGHARYYTFTLDQSSDVTISLESEIDTFLYLRDGDSRSGDVADDRKNDDHENAGLSRTTDSQIRQTLAAGDYTIEATTYDEDKTGSFTLTVTGLGGGGTAPPPAPGSDPCVTPLTADGSVTGTWDAACKSETPAPGSGSGDRLAQYYSFTLDQQSDVTITLTRTSGNADTYLYLREGDARSGAFIHEDDDATSGDTSKSEIETPLAAGTYTIEATTYDRGQTGDFTLTVTGLGGSGTTPPPGPGSDPCVTPLTADGSVTGTWDAACESEVSGRGHAKYYTFTLTEESEVTIHLESTVDPYLYLRRGDDVRSGALVKDNDDHNGSRTESQIQETLEAGTYTIEATTYEPNQTGSFTLTVTGLGAAAPAPAACSVGQTLSPGGSCSHDDFTITVESNGDLSLRFTGSTAPPQGLELSRNGNDWTIDSLP